MSDERIPEDEKRNVRAVLLSKIGGVLVSEFSKDYKKLLSSTLSIRKYGFTFMTDFLKAMPDVVRLEFCEKQMAYKMFGIGDQKSFMSSWAQKAQGSTPPRNKSDSEPTLDTDDAKKLLPNLRGLYTLCFPRRYMKNATKEDVEEKFCSCQSLSEVNIIPSFVFVRFSEKKEALEVLEAYASELDIRIAEEKNTNQNRSGNREERRARPSESENRPGRLDRGNRDDRRRKTPEADNRPVKSDKAWKQGLVGAVRVFIGNINNEAAESDLSDLCANYNASSIDMKFDKNDKRKVFALVGFSSIADADRFIEDKNKSSWLGRNLVVREAHECTRQSKKESSSSENAPQDNLCSLGRSAKNESDFEVDDNIASNIQKLSSEKRPQQAPAFGRGHRYSDNNKTVPDNSAGLLGSFDNMKIITTTSDTGTTRSFGNIRVGMAGSSDHGCMVSPQKNLQSTKPLAHSTNQQSVFDNMPALEPLSFDDMPELEGDDIVMDSENLLDKSSDSLSLLRGIPPLEKDGTATIFVGNFPYNSTEEDLYNLFLRYDCLNVKVINNSDPTQSTYAFVTLPNLEVANQAVLDMDQSFYNDRCLLISLANSDKALRQKIINKDVENITCTISPMGNSQRSVTIKSGLPKSPTKPYQLQTFDGMLRSYMSIYTQLNGFTSSLVIQPKTQLDLLLTSVHDNTYFWAQDLSQSADMDLLAQIHDVIKDPYSRPGPARDLGRCVALYQDQWYRAWIVDVGKEMFEVFFIDFGNRSFLTKFFTSCTSPCVWEIPPLARPFMLSADCGRRKLKDLEMTVVSAEVVNSGRNDNNYVTEVKIAF